MKSITTKIIVRAVGIVLITTIGLMAVFLREFTAMSDTQSTLL